MLESERGHARVGVCVSKLNSFSSGGKLDRLKLISNSRKLGKKWVFLCCEILEIGYS